KNSKENEISEINTDNPTFLKKNTSIEREDKKIIRVLNEGKVVVKYEDMHKKTENSKLKTMVIEQDDGLDISLSDLEGDKDLIVPFDIKEKIESLILKILYDKKSVKSLKILAEIVLESAVKEKIILSEKQVNLIIHQLNKEQQIQFSQRDGWKIKI
ncbi:MAG: hypothetical protein ACFFC3_13005, partial [Candidatus Odinarchaeota archaeon]